MASKPRTRAAGNTHRLKAVVRGAVQGVGFRPFVFRLAEELGLKGWVNNSAQGVFLEVEGPKAVLERFLFRLEVEKPPRSSIQSLEASWLDALGYPDFQIRESEAGGSKTALVLPDIATCPDCLREIFDAGNRRYFYPFTNCTNCGPRFSIIEALPYDRGHTSMKRFTMCPQCQAEYDNPRDRRFHAQPNACPVCGPHLELWDEAGKLLVGSRYNVKALKRYNGQQTLEAAAEAIRAGRIVAVKGLGGFHLMVAAHDDGAVRRLRERKHREEKPFAVMFPSLESVRSVCEVSPLEERLLRSPEAPIVLLRRLAGRARSLSPALAPNNPNLGVLLPYTPLHHLLLSLLGFPVVATSGNLSDEPICIDEQEAVSRLAGIAELFLVHNRPIVRHVDDSVVRVMAGREMVMRRARGFAPLPVELGRVGVLPEAAKGRAGCPQPAARAPEASHSVDTPGEARRAEDSAPYPWPSVLAVGAHLKNAVALSVGPQVFVSQHIGDLETDQAFEAFRRVIADFEQLYECRPALIGADAHPDYLSTKFAQEQVVPVGTPFAASLSGGPEPKQGPAGFGIPPLGGPVPQPAKAGTPNQDVRGPAHETERLVSVQHHVAHVLSCMAENELQPPVLGVSWDGTGYGLDGTVWGGEFFLITETAWERVAHLRPFRLPGGDKAVKEPRRTALGLLFERFGEAAFARADLAPVRAFTPAELAGIKAMLGRRLNSPLTSSVGRLFDAVAALVGLRQQVRFEGQAAMELEFAGEATPSDQAYAFSLQTVAAQASSPKLQTPTSGSALVLDWAPVVESVLADLKGSVPVGQIAARFHNGLVEAIIAVARRLGQQPVVLSGGCFQNRYLTERAVQRLEAEGFRPYWHQRVPPNDGGIALGQVVETLRQQKG